MNALNDFTESRERCNDKALHHAVKINYRDFGSTPGQIQNQGQPDRKYQCPMKCQGEKTYNHPGKCPGSKMDLIPVEGGHVFY